MKPVIMVCGHGRCGSSLVMQMLQAGGIETVGDYPAFEPPESWSPGLTEDWLRQQYGRAVKIIDPHLTSYLFLPRVPRVVIWLDRDSKQQAKSIVKFGSMVGGLPFKPSQWKAIRSGLHRDRIHAFASLGIANCRHLRLNFENVIESPQNSAAMIWSLLQNDFRFDVKAAASVVVPRSTDCLPYLLEAQLIERMNSKHRPL